MPDVAVLGIKVENGEVVKATASLNSMEVAGAKAEITTSRLSRRMALAEIEARKMDAALKQSVFSVGGFAHAMGISERTAEELGHAVGKLGVALGAVALIEFIGHKTIEETIAAQNAMAQLEAAVMSTGGVAGRTVEQLDELSKALQRQTTFSDEAVKGAEAMLLTFDKIRGTEFDRATAAVTDLATRLGGDLQGAAIQVGKALQDPTTGLTALRRSGVSFSESQIALIKSLYDSGQAAEGQRVILAELEHQFGGSAAAARDTLGGALAGLKNAWGDLFEVTKGGSQGTVDGLNAITRALETSGLSMGKVLKDATVDWETMRASIEKVRSIMSLQIGPGFLEQARAIIQRIDLDLSAKLAALNAPAKVGAGVGTAPGAGSDQTAAAKAQRERNEDMVREAQQAAALAAMEGKAQQLARIEYEETNKVIKAQRDLKGDLLDETLRAIHEEAAYKRGAVQNETAVKQAKDIQEILQNGVIDLMHATEHGVRSMMESLGSLIDKMLDRLRKDGQTNIRLAGAGIAIAGGLAGYDAGHSLYSSSHGMPGNYARGALGGAASGAAVGYSIGALGGPIGSAMGAVIGGAAGAISGLLGIGSASKEAARQMAEAQKQIRLSMESLRAAVAGDALAQQIAAVNADREQRRLAIEDAYQGGGAGSDQVRKRNAALAEMNALEDKAIAQLREAAALQAQQFSEDLQVRLLTAQGHTREAEALRLQLAQQREMEDAIRNHADPATIALLEQVHAQEKLAAATHRATSAALNMVEGYKLQAVIFDAMAGRPASLTSPAPSRSAVSGSQQPIVIENVTVLDGKVIARSTKRVYKDQASREFGDESRWAETS